MVGSARACPGGFSRTGVIRAAEKQQVWVAEWALGAPRTFQPQAQPPCLFLLLPGGRAGDLLPLASCSQKWPPQVGLVTRAFLPPPQMAKEQW